MTGLILYDIPSKEPCACWSPNPWKTRLALNYKGLDYKTEWTEYPDIAPKLKSFGLAPNDEEGATPYTVPTLRFDADTVVMDSKKIAVELEKRYPEPPLHLDSPTLKEIEKLLPQIMMPLRPFWVTAVPREFLTPASIPYFERTRAEKLGMPLVEFRKSADFDEAWKEAEPGFAQVAELLRKSGGPFFEGKKVSYADFVFVGILHFFRRGKTGLYERAVEAHAEFKKQYEACGKWLKRDDH